jgi:dolichol-phosphate mannosyltransferase
VNLVIVTPIHNERSNISTLAQQLEESSTKPDLWVIVDDGSTDGGAQTVAVHTLTFNTVILRRENGGGLIGGSAFTAWQHGVDYVKRTAPEFDRIMKLDADVNLGPDYITAMTSSFSDPEVGLAGGVLVGKGDREQTIHVPGPVKMYSRDGYQALEGMPRVVGFDVMDELAIKSAGLRVDVRKDVTFTVRRAIGASQGLVHGRRRNGMVCKWTGYWFPYFLLHVVRYAFRKPYGIGAVAMIYGYLSSPPSPYAAHLRVAHSREQRAKLKAAISAPRSWFSDTYGVVPASSDRSGI